MFNLNTTDLIAQAMLASHHAGAPPHLIRQSLLDGITISDPYGFPIGTAAFGASSADAMMLDFNTYLALHHRGYKIPKILSRVWEIPCGGITKADYDGCVYAHIALDDAGTPSHIIEILGVATEGGRETVAHWLESVGRDKILCQFSGWLLKEITPAINLATIYD